MSEMVERLAAAFHAYADSLPETSRSEAFIRSQRIALARIALEELKEPTRDMRDAYYQVFPYSSTAHKAMLSKALEE